MDVTKKTPGRKKVYATATDRQRAYLRRCADGTAGAAKATADPEQGVLRVSVLLPSSIGYALARLARHNGTTKGAILVKLIAEAEDAVTSEMKDDQIDKFYNVKH